MNVSGFGAARRGLTLVELIAVMVSLLMIAVLVIGIFPVQSRRSSGMRQLKDSVQNRALQQSMVVWANNNGGNYPLPSALDTANATVAELGNAKDTTANIFSLMIFNGNISTEICIAPPESNTAAIQEDLDYQFEAPKAAVNPANALWDPAFSADFSTPGTFSNFSYAQMLPSAARREQQWKDTSIATEAVIGNRGPEIAKVAYDRMGRPTATLKSSASNTLLIHGGRSTWEGHVAYNDGHVTFETALVPSALSYKSVATNNIDSNSRRGDLLFLDEPDDSTALNAFLGVFIKAGDTPADFTPIWD